MKQLAGIAFTKRTMIGVLCFAIFAVCRSVASNDVNADPDKEAWKKLLAAISANDQKVAQGFVGKTVCAEGSRGHTYPTLSLVLRLQDDRLLEIRVVPKPRSRKVEREIRTVARWSAAIVAAKVVGTVRAIDINKPEIVVEPVTVGITAAQ